MGNIKSISIFASIVIVSIAITYFFFFKQEDRLPIYQPIEINPALVDSTLRHAKDHRISDFTLVNHLGDTVTKGDVEGQVLVVDFFYALRNHLSGHDWQLKNASRCFRTVFEY